jgi:hypothetical protein
MEQSLWKWLCLPAADTCMLLIFSEKIHVTKFSRWTKPLNVDWNEGIGIYLEGIIFFLVQRVCFFLRCIGDTLVLLPFGAHASVWSGWRRQTSVLRLHS